jgi:uncharacterized protein (TIGR03437 family)
MRAILVLAVLAATLPRCAQSDCKPNAPCYSREGLVNAASSQADHLAPYTFAALYGTGLSWTTRGRTLDDSHPHLGGVSVLFNGVEALVYYVSPLQVNLLIPFRFYGEVEMRLGRDSVYGPPVRVRLAEYAPTLFQFDLETVIALRYPDWAAATREAPARRGEYVALYATGLGDLAVPIDDYSAPDRAIPIKQRKDFRLLLDGAAVEDRWVEYVGSAPSFSGLYQVNLKIPDNAPPSPEIRIAIGDWISPPGIRLMLE